MKTIARAIGKAIAILTNKSDIGVLNTKKSTDMLRAAISSIHLISKAVFFKAFIQ